jgi:uncharacterized membrane protein
MVVPGDSISARMVPVIDRRRRTALVAALASAAWLCAIGGAAIVRAQPHGWPAAVSSAAGLVYVTASFVCHQRPERSFHVERTPLPVCARCVGLYVGAALGLLLAVRWNGVKSRFAPRSEHASRLPLLLVAAPTVLSVGLEWLGGPSPLWTRTVTALPLGGAVGVLIACALTSWGDEDPGTAGTCSAVCYTTLIDDARNHGG